MAEEDASVRIGRLRWVVTLYDRVQTAQTVGTGIDIALQNGVTLHADVQPVGALTFYGGEQVDAAFTHRIFTRWHGAVPQTKAITRVTICPDQTTRTELFRVRRWKELGGRKRFVLFEVVEELQS